METENVLAPMEWRGAMTALVTPPNSYWRLRSTPPRAALSGPIERSASTAFFSPPRATLSGPSATFVSRAPAQHVQPPPGRRFGRIWPWGGVGRGAY